MITYLINVNNCINMDFYDFFFFESEARRKIVIINVKNLDRCDKQMKELILEMENRYFESKDEYQILFCVPRVISSENDFTDNSDFVITYKIRKALERYMIEYSHIFLFSFIYCPYNQEASFYKCNNSIGNDFFCKDRNQDFPDFSEECVPVTKDTYPAFLQKITEKIERCPNANIRRIFSEYWDTKDLEFDGVSLSERETFLNVVQDSLARLKLDDEHIASIMVDTADFAGDRNLEIRSSLCFIDFLLNSGKPFGEENLKTHEKSFDQQRYAAVLKDYTARLSYFSKKNPADRQFTYEYREPEQALKDCEDQYEQINSEFYRAIRSNETKPFMDTIDQLKGKNIKDEGQWDQAYKDILGSIERSDSRLTEYMDKMSDAFANCEVMTDTVTVSAGNIDRRLNDLDVDFKKVNAEYLEVCNNTDVGYENTLKAKNNLAKLNRRIRLLLRVEKYQTMAAFLLTLAFAVLTFAVPYSLGEPHVFSGFGSVMIWLLSNAVFAVMAALGSVAVNIYFKNKKNDLLKQVHETCDTYFKAYLAIASEYSRKLTLIAKIEKISKERDFLKEVAEEFILYENKLSYHKNCVDRLKKSLEYFHTLIVSCDSDFRSSPGDTPEINLNKDEKRNSFYYPKEADSVS